MGQIDDQFRNANAPTKSAYLAVRLSEVRSRTDARKRLWHIGVVFPKSETALGKFKLETGFGGYKEIPLSALRTGEQFVELNLLADVGVRWVSPEVPPAYKEAIVEPLTEMTRQSAYIFAGAGGLRKQQHFLNWGCAYLLVRPSKFPSVLPSLELLELASRDGWSAAMVTLPSDPNEELALWVQANFGLSIAPLSRRWGILYPPPIERDADGDIITGASAKFFLGFQDDDEEEATLSVATSEGATSSERSIIARCVVPIAIPESRGGTSFQACWGGKYLDKVRQERVQLDELSVDITFREGAHVHTLPLHHRACRDALSLVRRRDAQIIGLTIPPFVAGQLRLARSSNSFATVQEFVASETWQRVDLAAIATLQAALIDPGATIDLTFGAFGRAYLPTIAYDTANEPARRLTHQERAEAEHVLRLGNAPVGLELEHASDARIYNLIAEVPIRTSRHRLLASQLGLIGAGNA